MKLLKYIDSEQEMKVRVAFPYIVVWAIAVALLFVVCLSASAAQRPRWVNSGEAALNARRSNSTYYFKIVQNIGPDLSRLKQNNMKALSEYIGSENHVKGLTVTDMRNRTEGSAAHTTIDFDVMFTNEFTGDVFYAALVDEYWEREGSGPMPDYHYYALFAVSANGAQRPTLDRFEVTRRYGAAPAFMSVIPGAGQLMKGQRLKGGLMLGGAAVGAGAIIFCENRRAYYQTRIIEQPKFAREYNSKSNNYATARNVAIGATGALVVWSFIDAALLPGATRLKITPASTLSVAPALMSVPRYGGAGVSLAFTF